MRKFIGFIAGLLLPAAVFANPILSNTLTLGNKAASDKKIVFDKGAGASNPMLKWNNSTSKIQFANDGTNFKDMGSGAGGINLIANGDAEDGSTTGWTKYAEGGASFVDGVGAGSTNDFTNVSATPLRDTKSFLYTSGTAGDGACYTFTVQPADQARMLRFTGEYQIASGTYPTDDLHLWIYDVTNGAAIQPAPYKLTSIASGVKSPFMTEFQTSATGTSYRACFHQGTTATYTVKLDTLSVGPTPKILGTPAEGWKSFTSTLHANLNNATQALEYSRVGDSLYIRGKIIVGSGDVTGAIFFSIPSGLSIRTSLSDNTTMLGYATGALAVSPYFPIGTLYKASNAQLGILDFTANAAWNNTTPGNWTSGDIIHINSGPIPIEGWSSSTVMSEGAATRVVAADYSRNSAQTIVGNGTDQTVVLNTVKSADGVSLNTSTGIVTIQVPGTYRVSYTMYFSTGATATSQVYMGLVPTPNDDYLGLFRTTDLTASKNYTASGTGIYKANAGSTLRLVAYSATQDITVNGEADRRVGITVERISGPDQIAASEDVIARYTIASAQSVATGGVAGILNLATKEKDTHNAVTTGASWKFTAPISGEYEVTGIFNWDTAAAGTRTIMVYKNGSISKVLSDMQGSVSYSFTQGGSALISLLAGEYIDIRPYQTSAGALNIGVAVPLSAYNYVNIKRVGNY